MSRRGGELDRGTGLVRRHGDREQGPNRGSALETVAITSVVGKTYPLVEAPEAV
jgi:hypothetical protein